MTVVPPSLRVVTGAPHNIEHVGIFVITGLAFGLAYELRVSVICAATVIFCALLELVQLAVPGRHARISDFLIDAVAGCMGIAIAWTMRQLNEGFASASAAIRQPVQHDGNASQGRQSNLTRHNKRT
jgi:VanZ family protein